MATPLVADAARRGLTPPQPQRRAPSRTPAATAPTPGTGDGLGAFMAALRDQESTNNYAAIGPTHPTLGRALGGYQIMEKNWGAWAREAGLNGANWRDPRAQDRVAAYKLRQYYNKYRDWGLVAAAWFGGEGAANTMRLGVDLRNVKDSLGTSVPDYVSRLLTRMDSHTGATAPLVSPASFSGGGGNHAQVSDPYGSPASDGAVFPVPGGNYTNDWGNARSGGRTHEGTDIFADEGTPALSMVGGEVVKAEYSDEGLGGKRVWVRGGDGNYYYYAHLADVTVTTGQRVAAGEMVGRVGTTGNAKGTPPHLHFGVAKGMGRGWFNPYPLLGNVKAQSGNIQFSEPGQALEWPQPEPTQPTAPDANTILTSVFDSVANTIAGGQREPFPDSAPFFDERELI